MFNKLFLKLHGNVYSNLVGLFPYEKYSMSKLSVNYLRMFRLVRSRKRERMHFHKQANRPANLLVCVRNIRNHASEWR